MRALILLAACASPAPPPPLSSHVAAVPVAAQRVLIMRALAIDGLGIRATWTIRLDGDAATLAVTRESTREPVLLADLDAASWVRSEADPPIEHAAVRHVGDHVALDFPSLELRCWDKQISVAPAGALLHHDRACEVPVWSTKERVRVAIWACGFGDALDQGQRDGLEGDNLDETLYRFAAAPGLELVEADCVKGLRLAR